ncbi:MAG: hypothetical protein ACYS8W_10260 [Planctomycetota bacterium]|jgi:hypothetical protein
MKVHWLPIILLAVSLIFAGFGCSGHKSDRSDAKDDESNETGQAVEFPIAPENESPADTAVLIPDFTPIHTTLDGTEYVVYIPDSFDVSPVSFGFINVNPQAINLHMIPVDAQDMILVVPQEPLLEITDAQIIEFHLQFSSVYNISIDDSFVLDPAWHEEGFLRPVSHVIRNWDITSISVFRGFDPVPMWPQIPIEATEIFVTEDE